MAETLKSLAIEIRTLAASIDGRFERLEARVEEGFAAVDEHFVEQRAYTESGFERLEKAMNAMHGRFDRLERKLDRFIETQQQTNQLVDRRLRAFEPPDRNMQP